MLIVILALVVLSIAAFVAVIATPPVPEPTPERPVYTSIDEIKRQDAIWAGRA